MIKLDSVKLMRDIRDKLSKQYANMTPEELSRIHESFPDIKWKVQPGTGTKSARKGQSRK